MVWAGISKQNRVRTEQVELHGLGGRFKTEQRQDRTEFKHNRVRTEQVELHGLGGRFETKHLEQKRSSCMVWLP